MPHETRFTLASGGVRLEAARHDGGGRLTAVVLHPHPQFGGDMENHVVLHLCEALAAAGATTVRFNTRGTGGSEGAYDGGGGEADDCRAALHAAREAAPGARAMLVGYSFGAMVAAAVAAGESLGGLILVSPPVAQGARTPLPAGLRVLVLGGDRDAVAPAEKLLALGGPDVAVEIVPGVDHTWWPGVAQLQAAVTRFANLIAE